MRHTHLRRPPAPALGRAARGLACLAALIATPAGAQSIAARIAAAPDGVIRMQYDSRSGVCGDGRDVVGFGRVLFARNFQSYGKWQTSHCSSGPLRVSVTVAGGRVQRVRTQVGGAWPAADGRVTDLGVVPATEASAYFFTLVPRLEATSGRDRLLLPAVLADASPLTAPLIALARDPERLESTRRQAIQWLGILGDPAGFRFLHTVIEDAGQSLGMRSGAIFALAHGSDVPDAEFAYLRDLHPRLGATPLKDAVLQGMTQDEERGSRWLIERASDDGESMGQRKNAIFWAGQSEATRTADIVRFYRATRETQLREHTIFVLSQRRDDAAIQALVTIAREDDDRALRGKALFWLAQTRDPRAEQLISDILLKP